MKKILLIILLFSFISCIKTQEKSTEENKTFTSLKNNEKEHLKIKTVKSEFLPKIENWEEYRSINELLTRFEKISPNEALNSALNLKDLSKDLKDSLTIKRFKISSFEARLNVLHNEALRLADMTYIPAIKAEEVNNQVAKILVVFSSLNEKINTLYTQQKFEDEINVEDLDINLRLKKLDSKLEKSLKVNKNLSIPPPKN